MAARRRNYTRPIEAHVLPLRPSLSDGAAAPSPARDSPRACPGPTAMFNCCSLSLTPSPSESLPASLRPKRWHIYGLQRAQTGCRTLSARCRLHLIKRGRTPTRSWWQLLKGEGVVSEEKKACGPAASGRGRLSRFQWTSAGDQGCPVPD